MYLNNSVLSVPSIGPRYAGKLEKLNIFTITDLINHPPSRYKDYSNVVHINRAKIGDVVTIIATLDSLKNQYTKSGKKIQFANFSDSTGNLKVIWFNQPYLTRILKNNLKYALSGKMEFYGKDKSLISPDYEIYSEKELIHTGRLVPVYPETSCVSSKWLRSKIKTILDINLTEMEEFLPPEILKRYEFLSINDAYKNIHFPINISLSDKSKDRLSFNELLFLELQSLFRKHSWQQNEVSYKLNVNEATLSEFKSQLPFKLTTSQDRSIAEVLTDMQKATPMNRMLEGDVGSGKTVVAAAACFASFTNGYQSVIMAPTQILASQHLLTLNKIFERYKIRTKLITSAGIKGDLGNTDIFIGTHALIHQVMEFSKVALVVIDEQHRFGVEQRAHLIKKAKGLQSAPHVLTMTATPIPRTIALTVYGDLDLSTLDELPLGRKTITTWIVPPNKRDSAYEWIKRKIENENIQVYIICPLIEESKIETMKEVKSVIAEFERLKKVFINFRLGLLHGKLKAKEKDLIIESYKSGSIDILVSTPVVEVGIDVPNATIMLIEGSERFGLSQLHQLRGRVGRSDIKSYCLCFTSTKGKTSTERLNALTKTYSGFELAELDLKMRGPGEIYGVKQHGFPELKFASYSDFENIKRARAVAQEAISNPLFYKKLNHKIRLLKDTLN